MKRKTIKLDESQYEQLSSIKTETGIPVSEQVRRAVREWLEKRQEESDKNNE